MNRVFQFPSNGKEHGKESTMTRVTTMTRTGFNSLQTGRSMESRATDNGTNANAVNRVSIPFKREGAWKAKGKNADIKSLDTLVSIPFKREGAWKGIMC